MTVNETDHFSEVVEMRISTFTPELENKECRLQDGEGVSVM